MNSSGILVVDRSETSQREQRRILDRASFPKLFVERGYRTGVEIGVADGRFAEHIMLSCLEIEGFHWYLVEPFVNDALQQRLSLDWAKKGIKYDRFSLLPYTSLATETLSEIPVVDFVYLDGLHTYENVFNELFWYWPKVRPGGLLAGHDFCVSKDSSLDAPKCGLYTEMKGNKKGRPVAPEDDVVRAVYDWLQYHPGLKLQWTEENFTRSSLEQQGYDYDIVLTSTRNPSWYIHRPFEMCGGRVVGHGIVFPASNCPHASASGSCGPPVVLSIILLYYGEVDSLRSLLQLFNDSWDDDLKQNVRVLIVDDGADIPAEPIVSQTAGDLNICVATVTRDILWNIGGARNLGVYVSESKYVFFLDIDCLPTVGLVKLLLEMSRHASAPEVFIDFPRISNGRKIHPHPAAMLIRSIAYWHVGGCDEDFVGRYGYTDVHFKHRLRYTKIDGRPIKVHHMSDILDAALETNYSSVSRDSSLNEKLFELKRSGKVPWSTDVLRFQWTVRNFSAK